MILTKDTTVVDLGCPSYPMGIDVSGVQATEKSGAGYLHIEDYVTVYLVRTYNFNLMPESVWDDLLDFFLNTTRMMLYEFSVEDDFGNNYTGRFFEPRLRGQIIIGRPEGSYWKGDIVIRDMGITGTGG